MPDNDMRRDEGFWWSGLGAMCFVVGKVGHALNRADRALGRFLIWLRG